MTLILNKVNRKRDTKIDTMDNGKYLGPGICERSLGYPVPGDESVRRADPGPWPCRPGRLGDDDREARARLELPTTMHTTTITPAIELSPSPADDLSMGVRGPARSKPAPTRENEQAPEGLALLQGMKRAVDVTGALAGLVLLSPLMLLIAVLIRLTSPGPVIFRQRRVGQGGEEFWFLKFRTMVVDAEDRLKHLESLNESACGVLFKIRDDPRVTWFGRFLRRSSLDELPQLWNVLRGEMSLVGPRPLQVRDSERLEQSDSASHRRRLTVLPGLTGAWQVGGRSETDVFGMLELDLDYIDNWSLALDLSILLRTFSAVLRRHGAY
jgi:lipopolysaccharide/colanic/teichoic acid biosynthesis glycosyltransferase